ncbi:NADH-quinone oxidoreductase subunit L [Acidimicrobiia bacterium EGI L10123]|uniref:NADH-quinone oxidoreductase subunit L n=1 Tax=Salinilacustrithrix flava TaxID=2957203 RepID=UPI003D7C187F|nr:NADH-quinone oxidoreductase subunit L [Acidimicrobiia bacterium EGI L10123]
MELLDLVWLIPALPLAGFLLLVLGGRLLGEPGAGWLATAMMAGSFGATVAVFVGLLDRPEEERVFGQTLFEWMPIGGWDIDFGFYVDPLSVAMCLFITGVGTLIHLYSVGYMHGDVNFSKFFLYLNLFAFSMLMLVLGDNLLLTFLGWEGVGACSYFLISFWFTDPEKASAGKKAFVTNRIGDWGFMVAIFACLAALGSISYDEILSGAGSLSGTTATLIAACLFVGAIGKSAQFPLYVWLPDAMAGPTPVSALIHAATMVTSGVYLLTRVNPIIAEADTWIQPTIAWVGAGTALFAATIAVSQKDIKKVLAYSTVSQLGYMFLAVGVGAYVPAVFHMITHAFFKALLFLGSGSVIHGMHEEQDMTRMGGLRKYMPITAATFIVGWLAIAGVPPFSGFFSKDEILLYAWAENPALWVVGLVTALLTAFYMSRQVFLVFFGDERFTVDADHDAHTEVAAADEGDADTALDTEGAEAEALEHPDTAGAPQHDDVHVLHAAPHESPWTMTLPLVALAGLAIVGGAIQLPFTSDLHFLADWLHPVLGDNEAHIDVATGTKVGLAVVAVLAGLTGIAIAYAIYLRRMRDPIEPAILEEGWRYDRAITSFMGGPGRAGFEAASNFDRTVVDGAVNGVGALVRRSGGGLRGLQSGFVRNYALGIAGGAVLLLAYFLAQVTL